MIPAMKLTRRRGVLVAALLTLVVLATIGAASAFWTSGGSGSGGAETGTAQPVTLSPGTVSGYIYPGGQASVYVSAANPNSYSVHVTSLSLDTSQGTNGFSVDGGHSACDVATLSLAPQTNGGAGWTIAAGGPTALTTHLTNALSMGAGAADACQGATFTVYLQVP